MKQLLLALAALIAGFSIHSQAAHGSQPRTVVETVYSAFAQGDMEALAGLMSPDIVWNEAEGNPYADMNPYIGPEAVMSGLMARFVTEWEDISVTPHEYVVEGDRVVVFGRYKETWKATGQAIDIPFVHSWTVEDGRLIEFQQFTDTAALVETMGERPGTAATEEQTQAYEQSAVFPADRSLVRPDHGVMLADDTLLIADQVNGLMALDPEGAKRPFGDFASAGYVHEPPERSAGPNGVAIEPDGIHVLVADILTGAIYRINTETEQVVRIHQHEFGANSARRDSSGAVWFSQSIRIRSYRFEPADGTLSEGRILAELPTPDNIELDSARRLCGAALVVDGGSPRQSVDWTVVSSPVFPESLVVDNESHMLTCGKHVRADPMTHMIQIRNVPTVLHRALKARAAMEGKSMSELLLEQMEAWLELPTESELRERLRNAEPFDMTESSAELIRRERDAA